MDQISAKLFIVEIDRALFACLDALRQAGEGLYAYQVVTQTGYASRPVSHALKVLARCGLATFSARRWQLTRDGSEFIAGFHRLVELPAASEPETARQPGGSADRQLAESPNAQIANQAEQQSGNIPSGQPESESLSLESLSFESLRLKDSKDQDSDSRTLTLPPSPVIDGQIAGSTNRQISSVCSSLDGLTPAEITAVLDATQILFGERVMLPGGKYPAPRLLLGLIAEAYHKRDRLRKPARVVWGNLQASRRPALAYLDDPLAYLPESFAVHAGLDERMEVGGGRVEQNREDRLGGDETGEDHEGSSGENLKDGCVGSAAILSSPSLDLSLVSPNTGRSKTARRCWEELVEAVKALARHRSGALEGSTWEKYLFPCRLVDFTPGGIPVFTILAAGENAAAWLEQHFKTVVRKQLVGITGLDVEVVFLGSEPGSLLSSIIPPETGGII